MSKSLFHLVPINHEEEPNSIHDELTALSLSTGFQARNHSRPSAGNRRENSPEFPGTPMKMKRQRSLNSTALTIGPGTGSNSSSNLSTNEGTKRKTPCMKCTQMYDNLSARRGYYRGDCSRTKPVNNGNFRGGEIGIYNQLHNGFIGENIGYGRGRETGGADSDPEVISADNSKKIPFQQQAVNEIGRTGAVGNGQRSSGRGGGGTTVRTEKLRHRMIKNRESAARSRARKLALEAQQQLENEDLKKQNDDLKKIVRMLLIVLRSKRLEMPTLTRSFSATF